MKDFSFSKELILWYEENKRLLPWRETTDPYKIWVSEIMLQQTRVEAVKPYYMRFLAALPTVQDLANADPELLNKLWQGLGYYSAEYAEGGQGVPGPLSRENARNL